MGQPSFGQKANYDIIIFFYRFCGIERNLKEIVAEIERPHRRVIFVGPYAPYCVRAWSEPKNPEAFMAT